MAPVISRLVVPCRFAYLKPAASFAREVALAAGFEPTAADMIHLAVEEAGLNAITHGYGGEAEASFEIVCEVTSLGMTIRIKEKGLPFDPARVQLGDKPPDFANGKAGPGLGAFLIKNAVNEMVFSNLGREGKELRLTKYLPGAAVYSHEPPAEQTKAGAVGIKPALRADFNYEVRALEPEEAFQLARCAYRTYGYDYDEYIYYPERIVAMMAEGLLYPVVAVSPGGEIVAHGALRRRTPDDPLPEAGAFFVDPTLRGTIIFIQLCNYVFEAARSLPGVRGGFARNVTRHVLAQRATSSLGCKDCGLFIGPSFAETDPNEYSARPRLRETRVLAFCPRAEIPYRELYPTPQSRSFAERIYRSLEIPFSLRTQETEPADLPDQALIESSLVGVENVADIRVLRHGKNSQAEVASLLRDYHREGVDVVFLYLDHQDAATGYFGSAFEDLGFLFSGVLPWGLEGRDALILQCPNNLDIDYASIKLYSAITRDILAYVERGIRGG